MFELDLSGNIFTYLPLDLSYFKNLNILDITNIQFDDLEAVAHSLASLPSLTNLNINLSSQNEALVILENLPKLLFLNGKSTKDDTHLVDIEEKEIEEISLNSELAYFHDVYKKINETLKQHSPDAAKVFYDDFQKVLKIEIKIINESIDNSIPNYIYATNVISSKTKIYKYFLDIILEKILPVEKDQSSIISLIKELNNRFKHNSDLSVEILHKLFPKITEKTSNLKNQLDEAVKGANLVEDELRAFSEKLEKTRKERDFLTVHFDEEKLILTKKIETLTEENRIITSKLLKRANDIIEEHKNNDMLNNLEQQDSKSNKIKIDNSTSNESLMNKNYFNQSQIVMSTRILTVKMLKDMINEIYLSKENYDKKCFESKIPKETMEQHMYAYLTQKYGLKVSNIYYIII